MDEISFGKKYLLRAVSGESVTKLCGDQDQPNKLKVTE